MGNAVQFEECSLKRCNKVWSAVEDSADAMKLVIKEQALVGADLRHHSLIMGQKSGSRRVKQRRWRAEERMNASFALRLGDIGCMDRVLN